MAMGAALALFLLWPARSISVNFVSDPFEATISVDGQLLRAADGNFCHTPCTVSGLPVGTHHVVFHWDAEGDPFRVSGHDGKVSRQNNLTNFWDLGTRRPCRMQPPFKGLSLGLSLWLF
jgi:hypothetical protein